MMSNGPCSCVRLVQSGWRSTVDLPEPDTPTRTTSASSGMASCIAEHPHLRWRPHLWVVRADRHEAHPVAVALGHAPRPRLELRPAPLEAVVAVAQLAG